MDWHIALNRSGEWLELDWELIAKREIGSTSVADRTTKHLPEPGSRVHLVKQWLIEAEFFPAKWINRLFSVGGIRWCGRFLQLHAFPEVDLKREPLFVKAGRMQEKLQIEILYEDDYCLVLFKPVGMPVHEANERQTAVLDIAAAQYAMSGSETFPVRHIHRLDADTSGAVLYSKNDLAQYRLDEAMRSNRVERHYIAAVHGVLKKNKGVIKQSIGKDRHISGKRRVAPGGEMAVTHYQCLARGSDSSLAALQLETGRTHQIRVHMSFIGHPLIGDSLYGGVGNRLGHQALHAERLIFPHPITGQRINVEASWPAWLKKFAEQMKD